jgi:SAM-dependent methyltransferase
MQDAPAPTQRFSDRADDYVRYRPGYPPAMLEWLRREHGVDAGWRVTDVGAGTGISTKMWLDAGHAVCAVEPNAAMREAAQAWLGASPRLRIVAATAEDTSLDSGSVDLVSAAQAFHWFDTDKVRAEWSRILRPQGLAVVFWNSRRLDRPFMQAYEQLLLEYGNDYTIVSERHQDDAAMQRWFGAGFRGSVRFDNAQRMDFDGLRGRLLSSSYAPQSGQLRHDDMIAALRALFAQHAVDGNIAFDYQTRVFVGTLP